MEQLLPDQLKEFWHRVEQKELLTEEFNLRQERGLAEYGKYGAMPYFWRDTRNWQRVSLMNLGFTLVARTRLKSNCAAAAL